MRRRQRKASSAAGGQDRGGSSIEVSVRVRPQLGQGAGGGSGNDHAVPASVQGFSCFRSVIVGSDQQVCFDAVGQPLLSKMNEGYNTTLLAYGQTGSGKTYTVFGPTGSLSEASHINQLGLVTVIAHERTLSPNTTLTGARSVHGISIAKNCRDTITSSICPGIREKTERKREKMELANIVGHINTLCFLV